MRLAVTVAGLTVAIAAFAITVDARQSAEVGAADRAADVTGADEVLVTAAGFDVEAVDPPGRAASADGVRDAATPDVAERRATEPTTVLRGEASWYGPNFAGRATANGETYDPGDLTAAHKTLPFGTEVRVTNRSNGRSVVVRINDRGPYAGGRVLDVSAAAAERLGMKGSGVAPVTIEVL